MYPSLRHAVLWRAEHAVTFTETQLFRGDRQLLLTQNFLSLNLEQITPNHKASGFPDNYTKFPNHWLTSTS